MSATAETNETSGQWAYQIRVYLGEELAHAARAGRDDARLTPLRDVLARHAATPVSQLQAFEDYVAEAEREGVDKFPLHAWTKATLADPEKRAKHLVAFALRIRGQEVYDKASADSLERDLRPLVGAGAVKRITRHDTNPAGNIPVPPEYRR